MNNTLLRIVCNWLINPPPLGPAPTAYRFEIMDRMLGFKSHLLCVAISLRGNAYWQAGCPYDFADYAACRDLWQAFNGVTE
jgi:hypothetical protein